MAVKTMRCLADFGAIVVSLLAGLFLAGMPFAQALTKSVVNRDFASSEA